MCVRDLATHCARGLQVSLAFERKSAQGRPGARCTRGLVCNVHKKCAHEHTGPAGASRPSLRNGFTAYNALPGERAFLPPSPLGSLLLKNLTPASRCQDHTSSPSASAPFVKGTSAATASHPALVTIAKRPSYRDGTKSIYHRFGPDVKSNSEKQKCIGGQVRSDEATRGADKRKSGAIRSRAGEPVPEIRTAKNPVGSKSRRGHYGGWAQTLGRECARVGLLSRFRPRSPAWIWRIPYRQSKTPSVAVKPRTGPLAGQ